MDLKDSIDISSFWNLDPTYPRVIHTSPFQNEDSVHLEDKLTEVPFPPTPQMTFQASLAHPLYHIILRPLKRGKLVRFILLDVGDEPR